MLSGPDVFVECPRCGSAAVAATMRSGNTFHMRIWTDGYRRAPMLVDPPPVVQCERCGHCYFFDHATRLPQCEPGTSSVREPSESGYYDAIRSGIARNRDEERLLRIRAWWKSNDSSRHPSNPAAPPA